MKLFGFILSFLFLSFAPPSFGAVEPDFNPADAPVSAPWYGKQGPAEQKADLDFVKGMRPHHAGALTMSQDYLKDPAAQSAALKQLARGIIHNQTFEIGMLDRVEQLVSKPLPSDGKTLRQIAEKGLAQKQRFVRAPMPDTLFAAAQTVSARDVQFAKGMAIHHDAALVMARDYLADPAATNRYLRLMCLDILRDQKMEIDFMEDVIRQYPGDAAAIKVDRSMIHGMEGMDHGGHHETGGHGAKH